MSRRRRPAGPRSILPRLMGAAALALAAGSAQATWSIVLIDTRTGEVAVGSATCLFGFDLQANTPVLLPMVGSAAAQSAIDADGTNRAYIRDRLLDGVTPTAIITGLATFDAGGHQTHQYGIGDALGGTATFTGTGAAAWCGGVTGSISQPGGDIVYAIQGNILTGAPVVNLAETAIRNTEGDLATRLMAGMEAARSMGGDGRCSCAAGPTLCGSPPTTPWQLSDGISYMLIARDGDREGSSPIIKVKTPQPMAIADLDKDGKPDLVFGSTNSVYPLLNTKIPTGPMRFSVGGTAPTGAAPRAVVARDFDNDGNVDVATCNASAASVSVLIGKGGGLFKTKVDYAVGTQPLGLVCANFDGDNIPDLVALNAFSGTPSISLLTGKGDGTFNPAKNTTLATTPTAIAVGDFNGDAQPDLAITSGTARTVTIYFNDGAGNFTAGSPLSIPFPVNVIEAADFDKDGLCDLVVAASSDRPIQFLHRTPTGFDVSNFNTSATGTNALTITDLDADGNLDFVVAVRTPNALAAFMGNGLGGFTTGPLYPINNVPSKMAAADMDGDGDLDIVTSSSGVGTITVTPNLNRELNLGPGHVAFAPIGCASGDYFMEFNVLAPGPGNQDPVFVDKDMLDQWHADRIDRPDAVRSTAVLSQAIVPSDGSSTVTIDITIRDWQGSVVTRPLGVVATHHGADLRGLNASDAISTIGPVQDLGSGNYRVTLTAGKYCGNDRIAITITDPTATNGMRPVVLMPSPKIRLSAAADRDANGTVDLADFMKFWMDFDASSPAADLTADGVINLDDFFAFFNSFDQPCVG